MSVRIPGEPNSFLINNYGDLFDEITASSLVKMDLDGKVYGKDGRFNAAGFTIHSGVYKATPDANCVMHTHTRAGTGVSVLKQGLRPISQDVLAGLRRRSSTTSTACRPRRRNATRSATPARRALGRAAQPRPADGRRHHSGSAAPLYMLERACEVEIIARGLDEPPAPIEPDIIRARGPAHEGAARVAGIRRDLLERPEARHRPEGHRLSALI